VLGAIGPHLPSLLALAQEHAAVEAELRQVTPESVAKILGVTSASVELGASGDGAVRSGPWINVERLVRLRDHVGAKVTVLPRDRHSIDIEWG
jgi:hypothetical protein